MLNAMILLAMAATGEVHSASPNHFEIESKAVVAASPAETYAMLGQPAQWWNSDHTYSGDAANMSLKLEAGGCFCEHVPEDGGSIEHMRIVYARPGATLRAVGGLGPLQTGAVAGTLTWSLKAVEGGTEVTQTYVVAGYMENGLDALAPIVDMVFAEQLSGLQKRLAR